MKIKLPSFFTLCLVSFLTNAQYSLASGFTESYEGLAASDSLGVEMDSLVVSGCAVVAESESVESSEPLRSLSSFAYPMFVQGIKSPDNRTITIQFFDA